MLASKQMLDLPAELEREIFELVMDVCPQDAIRLCLVAKRVKIWQVLNPLYPPLTEIKDRIERIMYHTIVLNLPLSRTQLFLRTVDARPAEFFSSHVKKLYMTGMVSSSAAERVLKVCTGVTDLACWTPLGSIQSLVEMIPRLTRISVNAEVLSRVTDEVDLSGVTSLTHLDIVAPRSALWAVPSLPSLTHLSIGNLNYMDHNPWIPVVQSLLENCKRLQALILITNDEGIHEELEDERVLIIPKYHHPKDLCTYWKDVWTGKGDFWDVASK